jgi:predicted dinucleotide-binding enzyme
MMMRMTHLVSRQPVGRAVKAMTTAIIGVGQVGSGLARNLVRGGERVVLAVPWLPEGRSSGSVVAGLLPPKGHYVKAFGLLGTPSLAASANRSPLRAVLFYATDDAQAAVNAERLISAAGFEPVQSGGLKDIARVETPGGDLHESDGLSGALWDADQARAAVAATPIG